MKKFMKFAAVAAAVLSLCVACQKDDEETPTLEGKQWVFEMWYNKVDGQNIYSPAVLDFGVTVPGKIVCAQAEPGGSEYQMLYDPSDYEIVETDATSGVIKLVVYGVDDEYKYSKLTNKTVVLSGGIFEIDENTTATLATTKIEILE